MHKTRRTSTWGPRARVAALLAVVLPLAGCAAGYSLVQPSVSGAGSYYTSDGVYSGRGYYDDYGTGPYYAGTSGYGYYNGTRPYSSAFGWYGRGYRYGAGLGYGYGYSSPWTLNFGVSNVWNFPGYWGPWYSTGYRGWGCHSWHCNYRYRGNHGHGHDHGPGKPGSSTVVDVTPRPDRNIGYRERMERTALRHDRYLPSPNRRIGVRTVDNAIPARISSQRPTGAAFAHPRPAARAPVMVTPRPTSQPPSMVSPRPAARPARPASPSRPVVSPRSQKTGAPSVQIR